MLKEFINSYKRYVAYRATYNELSRLTDKELYDLGIDRYQIPKVASEVIYGEEEKKKSNFFKDLFKIKTDRDRIEEYLSEAANTVDLENRLKNIDRGTAPWQLRAKHFSQGWVL